MIGEVFPAEISTFTDPVTSVAVRQLTHYKGHSHHLYFTNPGWYDAGRRLLFASDLANRTNLFSLDLASYEITQLTDLDPLSPPTEVQFIDACVNPQRAEAYFWYGRALMALDLHTQKLARLWERPAGFTHSMLNCTADGRHICVCVYEDLSARFAVDLLRGYVGFEETWATRPLSRILRVATDGGAAESVWEEQSWIGHVNTSPAQPHLLSFCHEGPWDKVDQRIWGLDMQRGQAWKIRPREAGEVFGHEYWFADGTHVGYHGRRADGSEFFGHIRYDNTARVEVDAPPEPAVYGAARHISHFHSNDHTLIVGDAGTYVKLWRWNGAGYDGPHLLCAHNSSMHIQQLHVHPRFTPDGSGVLFTSDRSGYGALCLADVVDFARLPALRTAPA